MLFSATLSQRVLELAYEHMNDPTLVRIEPDKMTVDRVRQVIYYPSNDEKPRLLVGLLKHMDPRRSMVFVNTRRAAEDIEQLLRGNGINAEAISGDVPQRKRLRMLRDFHEGTLAVLIGTDVASRGLHIPDVSHVFNYDLPQDPEDYVHRIGRTARAGAEGDAISFGCEEYVMSLPDIEAYIGRKIPGRGRAAGDAAGDRRRPRPRRRVRLRRGRPQDNGHRGGGGGRSGGRASRSGGPRRDGGRVAVDHRAVDHRGPSDRQRASSTAAPSAARRSTAAMRPRSGGGGVAAALRRRRRRRRRNASQRQATPRRRRRKRLSRCRRVRRAVPRSARRVGNPSIVARVLRRVRTRNREDVSRCRARRAARSTARLSSTNRLRAGSNASSACSCGQNSGCSFGTPYSCELTTASK